MTWLPIIIYIALFILIGYFLLFRPQKKRKQQEEELRSSLMLGDEITTIGGICGKIVSIKDDNLTIESSIDRTLMEVKNWAVRDVKKLITDDDKKEK
ncbi:MAG: preprotein translocase subunit YajC [Clostridia bacterium]|nr:preprotein translocase subunit YajC [Clostridia bacterium]